MLSLPPLQQPALSLSRARTADEPFQIDGFFRRFPPSPLPAVRPSSRATAPSSWSLVPCPLCSSPQAPSTRAARQLFQHTNSNQRTEFVTLMVLPGSVSMLSGNIRLLFEMSCKLPFREFETCSLPSVHPPEPLPSALCVPPTKPTEDRRSTTCGNQRQTAHSASLAPHLSLMYRERERGAHINFILWTRPDHLLHSSDRLRSSPFKGLSRGGCPLS